MKLSSNRATGRSESGRFRDVRPETQVSEISRNPKQSEQACWNSHEKAASRTIWWIALLLAIALVQAAGGVVLAKDKGATGTPLSQVVKRPEIRRIPAMMVALIVGTRPVKGCGPAWARLMAWVKKKALLNEDTVYAGISHDDPSTTPPGKERYDACVTVPKDTKGDGNVVIGEIAGRSYAVFLHRGPYEKLSETYASIHRSWARNTKFKVGSGPTLEIYKTPSTDTPPDKLLTEVCIPLVE